MRPAYVGMVGGDTDAIGAPAAGEGAGEPAGGRDYGRWWVLDARTLTTVAGENDRMDVNGVEAGLKVPGDHRQRH